MNNEIVEIIVIICPTILIAIYMICETIQTVERIKSNKMKDKEDKK